MSKKIIKWCINLLEIAIDEETSQEVAKNTIKEVIAMLEHYKQKK